jgi:ATP-binding cassette subfamily B protein
MSLQDSHYILYYHPLLIRHFKLSSEINKRSTIFQQYLSKVSSFSQEIFQVRVIKAYSLEEQHQNNMENLALESKNKSLAKVQSLFH